MAAADNLTISRNRRRTRLRSTALPTCLDTVNPTRTAPSSPRCRACRTKAFADARVPPAAARKSLRRRNRSKATTERALRLRTEPLAPLRATRSENPAPTFGRHPGAETVPTLAHQFARLVGAFHGVDSPGRARFLAGSSSERINFARRRAISAALYGSPSRSSMRRAALTAAADQRPRRHPSGLLFQALFFRV